jgi:hypothetical protein
MSELSIWATFDMLTLRVDLGRLPDFMFLGEVHNQRKR